MLCGRFPILLGLDRYSEMMGRSEQVLFGGDKAVRTDLGCGEAEPLGG